MLYYYMPGLDVSALSDEEFTMRFAHLVKIRQMEAESNNNSLTSLFQR